MAVVNTTALEAAPADTRLAFWINAYNAWMLTLAETKASLCAYEGSRGRVVAEIAVLLRTVADNQLSSSSLG
jgi:hypothetical protein